MKIGVLLEIEVVEQAGDVPEVGIAAEGARVPVHRRRDHQRVMALVSVVNVSFQESGCF
jgi:hypothetical protein